MRTRRRHLLKGIVGAPLLAIGTAVRGAAPPVHLQDSPVAGFQHHQGEQLWQQLKPGIELRLQREPDNRYDTNSVSLWLGESCVGYLPRHENHTIAALLDNGYALSAHILRLSHSRNPWERVQIALYLHT